MKRDEDKGIKFKYKFPKEYNPKYANGAIGGISTNGEIIVNFYLERQGLPYSITNEIDSEGNVGMEIAREPKDYDSSIIRYVDTGVVLSLNSAKKIHEWLGRHIETLEEVINKRDEDVSE